MKVVEVVYLGGCGVGCRGSSEMIWLWFSGCSVWEGVKSKSCWNGRAKWRRGMLVDVAGTEVVAGVGVWALLGVWVSSLRGVWRECGGQFYWVHGLRRAVLQ